MLCNILPLFVGLLSALLGGLIGWYWLKNSKYAPLLGILDEKEGHIQGLHSDINEHKVSYNSLTGEKNALSVSLNDWQGKHSNLHTEHLALGNVKSKLDNDFATHKSQSAASIVTLETDLSSWKKKYADIELAHKNTQTELETSRRNYEAKTKEFDVKAKDYETRIADADTKYASLKSNHEREVEKYRVLTITHNTLTGEKDGLVQSLTATRQENEQNATQWQNRYATLEGERNGLTTQLQTTQQELESNVTTWRNKYGALENTHNTVTSELNQTKESYSKANADWDVKFKQVESERNTLTTQLQTKERELTESVSTWQNKYSGLTVEMEQVKETTTKVGSEWENRYKQIESERNTLTSQLQTKERELHEGVSTWQNKYQGLTVELEQVKETTSKAGSEWENKYRQIETERNALNAQYQSLQRENTEGVASWQNKYNTLTTELEGVKSYSSKAGSEWETRYNSIIVERDNVSGQLRDLRKTLNAAAADFENKEIELETEIQRLRAEMDSKPQGIIARDKDEVEREQTEILERIRTKMAKGNTGVKLTAWAGGKGDNLKRLRGVNAFVEKKMNASGIYTFRQVAYLSNDEQTQLNGVMELTNKKFQKEEWVFQAKRLIGLISEESPDAVLARIRTQQGGINFDRIGSAAAESKDNLQLVNYITAFDEAKLNALGIFKYSQIANFNKTDVKLVNKLIEIEEGRIANEDWITQANYLNTSAFEATLSRIKARRDQVEWSRIGMVDESQLEDLQVVSGIGLFIEQKLYALGIYRLEQIAKFNSADEAEMNNILELVPGHIQGDEWVGQSKKLVKGRK
jgi:predicted flap endonuclease-1-like 5' DNA nuclease